MTFDRLLRRQLQHLLLGGAFLAGACSGGEPESLCDEVTTASTSTGGNSREPGYLTLPLGESCPEDPDVSLLTAQDCCPTLEPVESCGLSDETETTQIPYYVGYTTDTGPAEVVTVCTYDAVFEVGGACCGRPLYVGGEAVLASVVAGPSDWRTAARVEAGEAREVARAYWLEVARLEHASVASFGRVALELLAHGAPADLVARCHEAALDEVRHAQLAFGLASALGEPVGPGALPLGGQIGLAESLADVAEALVREGCIGETLAALEAAARLRGARGAAADALATIADDEARHAGLAWATLKWLVEVGGQDVVTRVDAVFAEGPPTVCGVDVPGGAAMGLLSSEALAQVYGDGWRTVVLPAWAALRGGDAHQALRA